MFAPGEETIFDLKTLTAMSAKLLSTKTNGRGENPNRMQRSSDQRRENFRTYIEELGLPLA
jgi:hypothetical protein